MATMGSYYRKHCRGLPIYSYHNSCPMDLWYIPNGTAVSLYREIFRRGRGEGDCHGIDAIVGMYNQKALQMSAHNF